MFDRVLDGCETVIVAVTSLALAFCAIYVGIAVAGMVFRLNPPDEDLLVSEAVVLVAFLPQLILVRRDLHVSVDLFVRNLPSGFQIATTALAIFCGLLTYALLGSAAWMALDRAIVNESIYVGDIQLAEWPARAMVLLGTVGGLLASLLRLGRLSQGIGEAR